MDLTIENWLKIQRDSIGKFLIWLILIVKKDRLKINRKSYRFIICLISFHWIRTLFLVHIVQQFMDALE